jgi:hypothetical protein
MTLVLAAFMTIIWTRLSQLTLHLSPPSSETSNSQWLQALFVNVIPNIHILKVLSSQMDQAENRLIR